MARKDLLKKAFRNNFIRRSVADLKSLGSGNAASKPRHASSTSLRSMYEDGAPVQPKLPMSTDDFPKNKKAIAQGYKADDNASSLLAVSQDANASRESVAEWLQTVPKDPVKMSSSEIRAEMEKADAERKIQVLWSHEQLLRDHRDLVLASDEMIASHLDTIETTLALLEVMDALSPHADALKREMLEMKQLCENKLTDLLPVKSRLEMLRAGKEYICLDVN